MSSVTYKLEKVDGRYYFNDGEKYALIDTGYLQSVSCNGMIGPCKVKNYDSKLLWKFNPTFMHDGQKIGAILCPQTGFSCLLKGETITIDDDARELPEHEWFLPYFTDDVPFIDCEIDGKKKSLFFDSGLRLPVLGDKTIVEGKEKLGVITEWVAVQHGLAEVPYYNATFDFPCGFHVESHLEHDNLGIFWHSFYGGYNPVFDFLGIDFFSKYDLFISAIKGKSGLAIIKR